MKSEIRFKDREHLAFYNMVLKQTRKDDPYHKAFFYVVGIYVCPFVVLATHLSNILLVVSINLIDPVTY